MALARTLGPCTRKGITLFANEKQKAGSVMLPAFLYKKLLIFNKVTSEITGETKNFNGYNLPHGNGRPYGKGGN